jgi:hypothetical protein
MIITNLLCNKDIDTNKIKNMEWYIIRLQAIKKFSEDANTILNSLKQSHPEYFI